VAPPDPSELTESYDVVILGFEPRAEPAALGLQRMFGVDRAAADALLLELPKTVRRGVNRPRAEYFRRALVSIGAHVEIRNALGEALASARPPSPKAPTSLPRAAPSPPAQTSRPPLSAVRAPNPPTSHGPPARAPIDRTLVHGTAPPTAAHGVGMHTGTPARTELAPLLLLAAESPAARAGTASAGFAASSGLGLDMDEARWDRLELAAEEPGVAESFTPPSAKSDRVAHGFTPTSARPSAARSLDEDLPLLERWQLPQPGELGASNQLSPVAQRAIASVPAPVSARPRSGAPSETRHEAESGAAAIDARDHSSPDKRSGRALAAVRGARGASAERNSSRASVARHESPAAQHPRSFWECVPEAVQFPWLGRGRSWLLSIGAWALVTNLVAACLRSPVLSGSLALFANAGLLALCADYHRRCMWSAVAEADALNQSPQLSSARGFDFYLRSGAHIAGFALVSQLPIVVWLMRRTLDSGAAGAREVLGSPAFWLLAALPGMYWPMAIATASHANRFAGVWHVWIGLRAIVRAPLEYAATVGLGALSFALPWLACVIVAQVAGLPGPYFAALAGVPLGMSHAVMGTLTGQLLRTRPEVFE
jgi:hypothetical protein